MHHKSIISRLERIASAIILLAGLEGCASRIHMNGIIDYIDSHPDAKVEEFTDFVVKQDGIDINGKRYKREVALTLNKSSRFYPVADSVLKPIEKKDGTSATIQLILDLPWQTEVEFSHIIGGVFGPKLKTTYYSADGSSYTLIESYDEVNGRVYSRIDGTPDVVVQYSQDAQEDSLKPTAQTVYLTDLPKEEQKKIRHDYREILKGVEQIIEEERADIP